MNIGFEQTTLPVLSNCDVVVVGGSFGGIAAALQFAQSGYRVTLVEPRTYLGREITATLRPWLKPADEVLLPHLIATSLNAAGKQQPGGKYALNMDTLKIHLEDVLLGAGVKLLYASVVVGIKTQDHQLQGVVIGNKSGRQVITCRLLLDTSETALVARLLNAEFEPAHGESLPYRRTLEFDNIALQSLPDEPLIAEGSRVVFHSGYREKGHVLAECFLDLPFSFGSAFDTSARETQARHQTMAVAATLSKTVTGFEAAYLSGASYELYGRSAPRLLKPAQAPEWAQRLSQTVNAAGTSLTVTSFASPVAGVWYLNEAVPLADVSPEAFYDPIFTSQLGAALGQHLADHWQQASAPLIALNGDVTAPVPSTGTTHIRESSSPQRGGVYQRVAVEVDAVPVLREADVLVVGGGSSGATAAITAAGEGLRTILTEMNPGLGGTGTYGGVHSYWFGRRIGFAAKVMQYVDDMHVYLHHPQPKGIIPKWNIEAKSYALLKAADAAGVEALFNTFVIGTVVEENRVCGAVVATRMGIAVIRAQVVIDASGDGDVAAFAGAEYVYGNERDHIVMWYALAQFPRPGLTRNHFTSMVDVSNIEDYTRAILAGRRRGSKEAMHDHGIYVAPRESRHILGDYVLTLNDQIRQRCWDDVVNIAFSNHDVKGHSGSDWLRIGLIPPNLEIEIPYRALLPRGLENILVVGKAISASHDALPAIRMQADLENLGGVAALAAALAIRTNVCVRDVAIRQLQARLVEADVLPSHILQRDLQPHVYTKAELQALIDAIPSDVPLYDYSDMELTDIYKGLIPFVEICCAGEQAVPLLEAACHQSEGRRKVLLAQALALVGSVQAVPVLTEAIEAHLQGDTLPARTAHIRYTQLPPDHGAMPEVVYLLYSLGMVADERALPVWQRVVELLASVTEQDFYDDLKGVFYYVDAVCFGMERLAAGTLVPLLQRLHDYNAFHAKTQYGGFQPDYVQERMSYLELVIGRTLTRCGSADGYAILISYLNDSRALLAEHAHSELVAITGEDCGKDMQAWISWLEFNGDDVKPAPWRPPTDAVQAWNNPLLTAHARSFPVHTVETYPYGDRTQTS